MIDCYNFCNYRCDSPGHSAKFESYNMLDPRVNKIVHTELVQVSDHFIILFVHQEILLTGPPIDGLCIHSCPQQKSESVAIALPYDQTWMYLLL